MNPGWNPVPRGLSLPVLFVVPFLAGCATALVPPPATAQDVAGNIPVLVVAEDEDRNSLNHCNDVHKRVQAELRGAMQRRGFQMLDETMMASDLGFTRDCTPPIDHADRRDKRELVDTIKLMNQANQASTRSRAWVLYRIHAQGERLTNSTRLQVRIGGEIYDSAANTYLDSFEMPRETFPAPADCGEVCINEVLGDRADDIAASLGVILATKLERYSPPSSVQAGAGPAPVDGEGSSVGQTAAAGLVTPFTVTLRHFSRTEALTIIGIMADEFPDYVSHDALMVAEAVRKYDYRTRQKAHKLEEWLYILLRDMGFAERDYLVRIAGTDIQVEKLVPTPDRPVSDDERNRFR